MGGAGDGERWFELMLSQFDLLVHEDCFIDSYFLNPCSTVNGKLLMQPVERVRWKN